MNLKFVCVVFLAKLVWFHQKFCYCFVLSSFVFKTGLLCVTLAGKESSHSVGFLFAWLMVYLAMYEQLSFMKCHLSIVGLNSQQVEAHSESPSLHIYHSAFCLCFLLAVSVLQVSSLGF